MRDDNEPLTPAEKAIMILSYVYVASWVAIMAAAAVWIVRVIL